jgi:hypothetical protein
VADSFHWPLDSKGGETFDPEPGTPARGDKAPPAQPGPDALPNAGVSRADDRATGAKAVAFAAPVAAPVIVEGVPEDAWFASEDDEPIAPPPSQEAVFAAEPAHVTLPRSAMHFTRLTRWAVPALMLIVAAETGWLVFDRVAGQSQQGAAVDRPASPGPSSAAPPAAGNPAPVTVPPSAVPPLPATPAAAGMALSASVPPANPGVSDIAAVPPGSVSIPLPFQVQVYEGARFIGINAGNLPLTAGSHQLQLVNDSLGFRTTERVVVTSGRTTRITATVPTARVQLNAVPWAEVTVDGTSVGETPLGNVPMSIGAHTLVFRHPQLGEQTRNVVVTAQGATRISVDLRN